MRPFGRTFLLRLVAVITMTVLFSYCTNPDSNAPVSSLSPDEQYLVEAYAIIIEARDLHTVNPLKSESLFAVIDSTIDTLRIANTIRGLNEDPDRWLAVFKNIELELRSSSQGQD